MTRKYRLLIVDDSRSILEALSEAFVGSPYEVVTCDDPLKAYQRIEDEKFDIVLSDIVMPGIDGLTLLRKIKGYDGTIQVIMMTGDITINNTLNAFRYGANDIFFKPLKDKTGLMAAVDEAAKKLNHINDILKSLTSAKGADHAS